MQFLDRHDAGRKLAALLSPYKNHPDAVVIGLPRGGVVVAYEVAQQLELPLDVVFPRKVGCPYNPELAVGAITETGAGYFNHELIHELGISDEYLQHESEKERQVAEQRVQIYRKECPKISLKDKLVIIVDDGLATGATMQAAILSVKQEKPKEMMIAVPVAPPDTMARMKKLVDKTYVLHTPEYFMAVGQFYRHFDATENEEVVELLKNARQQFTAH